MTETKSAFIAIVGRPNVGKSSLLNQIIGQKVAIVTPKPQTTRSNILGIHTEGETQLVFVDTPGLHLPKTRLGQSMVGSVSQGLADTECCILVADAAGAVPKKGGEIYIGKAELELIERVKKMGIPGVLALNKIDLIADKAQLLPIVQAYNDLFAFEKVYLISARNGKGTDELLKNMLSYAVPSPWFYDADAFTDQTERVLAAETVREKLLFALDKEIPHGVAVVVEKYHEKENIVDIEVTVFCERESHKGIIIGKNGAVLKSVGTRAREDLEQMLQKKVNLQIWIKVREDWRNKETMVRSFGFNTGKM